jgi:hypothetical protein
MSRYSDIYLRRSGSTELSMTDTSSIRYPVTITVGYKIVETVSVLINETLYFTAAVIVP